MSLFSSRLNTRISRPVASDMRANTGIPRKTSGHQSSPMITIFAGPPGFAISAFSFATSSAGMSVPA